MPTIRTPVPQLIFPLLLTFALSAAVILNNQHSPWMKQLTRSEPSAPSDAASN